MVLRQLATAAAGATGRDPRVMLQELLQGASVSVRRDRAQASLRRAGTPEMTATAPRHSAATELEAASAAL